MSDHITDPHASGSDHGLTRGLHSPLAKGEPPESKEPPDRAFKNSVEKISIREAARRRMPLGAASVQALEGAISITEQELDAARAKLERVTRERDDSRAYALNREEALDESQRRRELADAEAEDTERRLYEARDELRRVVVALGMDAEHGVPEVEEIERFVSLLATRAREAEGERDEARESEQAARAEQGRQRDRLQALVDERLSPREHLPTDALITILERGLAEAQRTQEHWRQHAERCESWMRDARAESSRLRAAVERASAELRHAYREWKTRIDPRLVARAIVILEGAEALSPTAGKEE